MAIFTLEDKQIVWTDKSSGICPSDVNLCCTVIDLFVSTGKLSWKNSSFQMAKNQTICSSKNLFILFADQMICPSKWFVRPLMWKEPIFLRGIHVHVCMLMKQSFFLWFACLDTLSPATWHINFLSKILEVYLSDVESYFSFKFLGTRGKF